MSVPHTGKLVALVRGVRCEFDGDTWLAADDALTQELNAATASSPKTHYTISELARHVLNKLDLLDGSQILSVESDPWNGEIPEDAID